MCIIKGHVSAVAYAINNDGVVGISTVDTAVSHAVRLRDGELRDLDIDENSTMSCAIDDKLVVGIARELRATREDDGLGRANVWEKIRPTELPSPGGPIS
jgi:probable HAF family extracellular repeat protein